MAEVKHARITDAALLAHDTRWLRLEMCNPELFRFRGGQYIIADSGRTLPSGKAGKRAYSIASCDLEQQTFELVVMRVGQGVVSNHMHGLEIGAELRFSGPWGKFVAPEDPAGRTLVLATDTGVTAALGLVRSAQFARRCAGTRLVWLRPRSDCFMPEAWLRARLPSGLRAVHVATLPEIGDASRVRFVRGWISELLGVEPPSHAFVSGDGAINYALLEDLSGRGVKITRDEVESFFNMPKKSA